MLSKRILWESLKEVKILEEKNKNISLLKKEIDNLYNKNKFKELSLKLLEFFKEVLLTAGNNYSNKEELSEDLYWFRYNFIEDEDEDSFVVSDDFLEINSEFSGNPNYSKMITKINLILN